MPTDASQETVQGARSTPGDALGLADDRLIDELCDRYEMSLQEGHDPCLDKAISLAPKQLERRVLQELLLIEAEYAPSTVNTSICAFLSRKYPAHASLIDELELPGSNNPSSDWPLTHDSDEIPPALGRYRVLGLLGQGGMGRVLKARDPELDSTVAIKVPREKWLTRTQKKRFLQEGRTAALLQHPNIVTVFDVPEDTSSPYIVSAYIEGVSLHQLAHDQELSTDHVVDTLILVADAIHYAHDKGVVHRDIKPANILIDQDGTPYVTDFGLARRQGRHQTITHAARMLGTPAYMSPEVASGNSSSADRRADVFSMGVMLYELLSGHPPFSGNDSAATLLAILTEDPKPLRSIRQAIPRDLETVCHKAMEKSPARRYQTALDFCEDLRRYRRREPVRASRPTSAQKVRRFIKRRPWLVTAMVMSIVTLAATGSAMALLSQRDRVQQENEQLRDLQTVRLTTSPPGARVAFTKLDPASGQPDPEKFEDCGVSPVEKKMPPGSYLVVAWTSDTEFHEVVRYIPTSNDPLPGAQHQKFWQLSSDGAVELDTVKLWDIDALGHRLLVRQQPSRTKQSEQVIVSQHLAWHPGIVTASPRLESEGTDVAPVALRYHDAIVAAERNGWRLPSLSELKHYLPEEVYSIASPVWSSTSAAKRDVAGAPMSEARYLVLGDRTDGIATAFETHQKAMLFPVRSRLPRNSPARIQAMKSTPGLASRID